MVVNRVCLKCGELNKIDSSNLVRKDAYDESGIYYKIMYFRCERCKEINVVQVDNMDTINMFRELKSLIIKVIKKKQKGQTVSPKDIRKKDKLQKELTAKRNILNEEVSGLKLFDENKKVIMESLTLQKAGDIIDSNL